MSRRQKQTTCFGNRIISMFAAVEERARLHNAHIVTHRPDLDELLEYIVPREDRQFCKQVWRDFKTGAEYESREVRINLPAQLWNEHHDYQSDGMFLEFKWRNDTCENSEDCFALPIRLRETSFTDDVPPSFLEMLKEWQINAIEWGLVRKVFDWLDDILPVNDFAQACYLMPMLPALVNGRSDCRAIVAAAGATLKNPMRIELEHLAGLQRANQILAASELIGSIDHGPSSPVNMRMRTGSTIKHPLWPEPFDAEHTAGY